MIEKIKNSPVARWILLIPGIVAAAVLASVICNIILFIKGSGGGTWFGVEITSDDPESKVGNGMGYYIIGYLIQPASLGGMPIYAGRSIAPHYKGFVGWTLFSLFVILSVTTFAMVFQAAQGSVPTSLWVGYIAFLVGSFIGAKSPLEE